MADFPIGFMLGNVGQEGSAIEADFLDEDQKTALLRSGQDLLFSLPAELRREAFERDGEDDAEPVVPAHSIDENLILSESDISSGSLPDEISQSHQINDVHSMDEEPDEEEGEEMSLSKDVELPILGYGEKKERIFCFSKIFTGGGLKYFFPEQRQEEEKRQKRIRQMSERIKKQRAIQQPPLEPRNPVAEWLADPKSTDDEASHNSDSYEAEVDEDEDDILSESSSSDICDPANAQHFIPMDVEPEHHLIHRKHFFKANLTNWEDRIIFTEEDAKKERERMDEEWKSLSLNDGNVINPHVLKDDWLDNIVIRKEDRPPSPKLIWDLNDPGMRFRVQERSRDVDFSHTAATILPPKEKKRRVLGPAAGPEEIFQELAYYNISKDERYMKELKNVATARNKISDGSVSLNAVCALILSTIPFNPSDEDALDYHYRISDLFPPENTSTMFMNKTIAEDKVEVIFRSITGRIATIGRGIQESSTLTVGAIYKEVQQEAFPEAGGAEPVFYLETPSIQSIDQSLSLQNVSQCSSSSRNIVIWVQFHSVNIIPNSTLELPSSNSKIPVRPPGAFGRRKELTAADGHVLLFEYLEEHPLLLFYPGMGLVLQSWCLERDGTEQSFMEKLESRYSGERWKYGQVRMIPQDKPSPFIGSFPNSEPIFSIESHLLRAPACAYERKKTDYLLVLSRSGNWSIRHITGTLAVGQQQPLVKIAPPLASNIKDFEERRLVSYACRKLSQEVRKTESGAKKMNNTIISVEELTNMFPVLSESVIKSRLKDRCQCIPIRGAEGSFTLKSTAFHHSESELRQILSPEEACAYDSCRIFKARMAKLGLKHVDRLSQIPNEKWKLAISMLPESKRAIASYIQRTIQGAPWNQSEGYHLWKGGKGQVSVVGPGEPSGRGICCSYVKEHLRRTEESAVPIKPQASITGTKADLRRLGAEEAVIALQSLPEDMQLMIDFEDLKKMDRWDIIRHVRAIATAAVQDGIELSPELSKFARNPRSTTQITVGLKRKVEQVFSRQLKVLRNEEVDIKPIAVKDKHAIKRDELPTKVGKRRIRRLVVMPDASSKEVVISMEKYDNIPWGGQEGAILIEGNKRLIEGRPPTTVLMEEQIVERPLMPKKPVIMNQVRCVAQTEKTKIVFNGNPQPKKKPKRPRVKLTKDEIWGNRLNFSKKKARTTGHRRPRVEINFPHTIESIEQEELMKALAKPKSRKAIQQVLQRQQSLASVDHTMDGNESSLMRQASLISELGLSGSLDLGSLSLELKAKMPYKTKDGRRMTGRKVLNTKILNKIFMSLTKLPYSKFFKLQVNKKFAPDYNEFVETGEEIWLDKIGSKIRALKYSTGQAFISDVQKLKNNAVAYNSPLKGRYGGPQFVQWAQEIARSAEEELEKYKDSIAEEEEQIKSEDTEKELKRVNSLTGSLVESSRERALMEESVNLTR